MTKPSSAPRPPGTLVETWAGPPPSIEAQIAALVRELAFRQRVYPNQVREKKMIGRDAGYQIACIEATIQTLRGLPKP